MADRETHHGAAWRPSIPHVVDALGRTFDSSILEEPVIPLSRDGIWCGGCRVPATWTLRHTRTGRDGRLFEVRGYFRLKGRRSEHRPGCRYDFSGQALEIVRTSQGLLEHRSGKYRLRLPLSAPPVPRADGRSTRAPSPDLQILEGLVLSTAVRVLRLLRSHDENPHAAELFEAEYNGHLITWGDFCWDVSRREGVLELISQLRRPDRPVHPIAAWGRHARERTPSATGQSHFVSLTAVRQGSVGARLRSRDPRNLDVIEPAHCAMGYGDWRVHQFSSERGTVNAPGLEVRLIVGHPSAVTSWRETPPS